MATSARPNIPSQFWARTRSFLDTLAPTLRTDVDGSDGCIQGNPWRSRRPRAAGVEDFGEGWDFLGGGDGEAGAEVVPEFDGDAN